MTTDIKPGDAVLVAGQPGFVVLAIHMYAAPKPGHEGIAWLLSLWNDEVTSVHLHRVTKTVPVFKLGKTYRCRSIPGAPPMTVHAVLADGSAVATYDNDRRATILTCPGTYVEVDTDR